MRVQLVTAGQDAPNYGWLVDCGHIQQPLLPTYIAVTIFAT